MTEAISVGAAARLAFKDAGSEAAACPTHGAYTATIFNIRGARRLSPCPKCMEEAYALAQAKREEELSASRAERAQAMLAAKVATARIPKRFQACSFENYSMLPAGDEHADIQAKALHNCRRFAETWPIRLSQGTCLVLYGSPGTGKNHIACAIANMVMRDHEATVLFGTVTDFIRDVKHTFKKDSARSESDAIADMVSPELLILDEVGDLTGKDFDSRLMFDILNARYAEQRPMILVSNLDAAGIRDKLGDRLSRRLQETGRFVEFRWPPYKKVKPQGSAS